MRIVFWGLMWLAAYLWADEDLSRTLYAPGEFSKIDGVCFSWVKHNNTLLPLIKEVALGAKVYVSVSRDVRTAEKKLKSYGCNMPNVEILQVELDSIWVRDYGPWFIYTEDGDREIIDLTYNRPRPLDDKFPAFLAKRNNWQHHLCRMVLPGGNIVLDGRGAVIMTDVVFDESQGGAPHLTVEDIERYMKKIFNCRSVYIIEDMEKDGTGHIDMFCKLLDERTLIVGEYDSPANGAGENYAILNRNARKLAGCSNGAGKKFIVHRIPMPAYTGVTYTYTNSLIVNDKVIVPVYGKKEDRKALTTYKRLLPRHKIVGFDCNALISCNGAIHCVTKAIMKDPLTIEHRPILFASKGKKIHVKAHVSAINPLNHCGVTFRWRTEKGHKFHSSVLGSFDRVHFFGKITVPLNVKRIEYYIHAEDARGMFETFPEDAPGRFLTMMIE